MLQPFGKHLHLRSVRNTTTIWSEAGQVSLASLWIPLIPQRKPNDPCGSLKTPDPGGFPLGGLTPCWHESTMNISIKDLSMALLIRNEVFFLQAREARATGNAVEGADDSFADAELSWVQNPTV